MKSLSHKLVDEFDKKQLKECEKLYNQHAYIGLSSGLRFKLSYVMQILEINHPNVFQDVCKKAFDYNKN